MPAPTTVFEVQELPNEGVSRSERNYIPPSRFVPTDLMRRFTPTNSDTLVPSHTRRQTIVANSAKPPKVHKTRSFGNWFRQLEAKDNPQSVVAAKPRVRRRVPKMDDVGFAPR